MKEILSLPTTDKTRKNLFLPLQITEVGGRTIGIAQSDFENFWKRTGKIDCSPKEKQKCLDKLQEACAIFCRGIAKYHKMKE